MILSLLISLFLPLIQGTCNYNVSLSPIGVLPPCYLASVYYPVAGVTVMRNYSFLTDVGGSWLIGFTFRQDPGFWTFKNPSLTANGFNTQLLQNSDLSLGGNVIVNGATVSAPANFLVWYQAGSPPQAAGTWSVGQWYDGAVGSFDGIYQSVSLNASTTYNISFSISCTGPSDGNAIQMGVYALPCADPTAPTSSCVPPASLGFAVNIPDSSSVTSSVSISTSGSFSLSNSGSSSVSNSKSRSLSQSKSLTSSITWSWTRTGTGTCSLTNTGSGTGTLTKTSTNSITDTITSSMTMTRTDTGTMTASDTFTSSSTGTGTESETGTSTGTLTTTNTNTATVSTTNTKSRNPLIAYGIGNSTIVGSVAMGIAGVALIVGTITVCLNQFHGARQDYGKDKDKSKSSDNNDNDKKKRCPHMLLVDNTYRGSVLPVSAPQTNIITEPNNNTKKLASVSNEDKEKKLNKKKSYIELNIKDLAEVREILNKRQYTHKIVG